MKASVSQFKSVRDIESNLRTIRSHIATASESGAQLICFPEASMVAYECSREELVSFAEQHAARFIDEVGACARAHAGDRASSSAAAVGRSMGRILSSAPAPQCNT